MKKSLAIYWMTCQHSPYSVVVKPFMQPLVYPPKLFFPCRKKTPCPYFCGIIRWPIIEFSNKASLPRAPDFRLVSTEKGSNAVR